MMFFPLHCLTKSEPFNEKYPDFFFLICEMGMNRFMFEKKIQPKNVLPNRWKGILISLPKSFDQSANFFRSNLKKNKYSMKKLQPKLLFGTVFQHIDCTCDNSAASFSFKTRKQFIIL